MGRARATILRNKAMTKSEISPQVRRFVLTSIASVPHMEALMLARETAPTRWNAAALARRLYVAPAIAAGLLADLGKAGLLACDADSGACYYDARSSALADIVDQLAAFYATHLVEITVLIHSRLDRQAQQFANAFDFRTEPSTRDS
jgi:hypothetical protein